jgi:protein-L-isoaspartate O-methyltransferase
MPQPLIDQLASPGRMFIPVGTHSQFVIQVDKDVNGEVTAKEIMDVMVRFMAFDQRFCRLTETTTPVRAADR